MTFIPVLKPCFLDDCIYLGAPYGRKRWASKNGSRLFEWDGFHGEIEVYDKRGFHQGAMNPRGIFIKTAVKGRRINV